MDGRFRPPSLSQNRILASQVFAAHLPDIFIDKKSRLIDATLWDASKWV
jgi:hypothetical protein